MPAIIEGNFSTIIEEVGDFVNDSGLNRLNSIEIELKMEENIICRGKYCGGVN